MSKVQKFISCDASIFISFFFLNIYIDFCLLMQLATIEGHIHEVLYLAISPDGQVVSPSFLPSNDTNPFFHMIKKPVI